jgi:hypothetical protein
MPPMNQTAHQFTRPFTLIFLITIAVLGFSLPVASLAQSGGPGTDHGIVDSIDDMKLDIRGGDGRRTRTYTETNETQWLNKGGQRIDAGDVVGKMVEVRFRWITGGSEALSVRITSNSSSSAGSSRPAAAPRSRSAEGSSFNGTWRNDHKAETLTITVTGENALLDYSPGSPDQGTVRGNYIYYQGLSRRNVGSERMLLKENGSFRLSADGMHLSLAHDITYPDHIMSETVTYTRVR